MDEKKDLAVDIEEAFGASAIPDSVVSHQCEECAGLERAFLGQQWRALPTASIVRHYDSLPLFTADAYRCYVAAYLAYAAQRPDSDVAEFLMYSLDHEHQDRLAECNFTPEQTAVILKVAEHIAEERDDFVLEIRSIRRHWSKDAG